MKLNLMPFPSLLILRSSLVPYMTVLYYDPLK